MLTWLGLRQAKAPRHDPVVAMVKVEPDWVPPDVRHVPAETHVKHLLSMASSDGLTGYVRSRDIVRFYGETCWLNGLVPLADRQILCELGTRLERRRLPVNGRSLTHYWMPDADAPNVVPLRKKKVRRKTSQSALRSKERAVRGAIAA